MLTAAFRYSDILTIELAVLPTLLISCNAMIFVGEQLHLLDAGELQEA
jgi:hypothetical protein